MKISVICLACVVSFSVIHVVDSVVKTSDVPNFMARCFGFYKRKTNLVKTPAGAIHAMCSNYYLWFESRNLNSQRKANPQTISYIRGLFASTKNQLRRFRLHRKKRQAGVDPAAAAGPGGVPPPDPGKKRVRKEIRMMSKKELQDFIDAVNSAKKNTTIAPNKHDALAEFHTGITSMSAHGGCNFHGWHRMYLLMFENALREEGERFKHVTVPYWDSRLDNRMEDSTLSAMFTHRLVGTCDGEVKHGLMADGWDSATGIITRTCGADGPLMTNDMVANVTRMWNMKDICGEDSDIDNDLEFHHNGVHRYIGGQMATLQSAVYDPIFWLHHAFIDLVWEVFRENQRAHGVDPETDYPDLPVTMGAEELQRPDVEMGFADLLVIDGLSNMFTDEWYTYAPPPTCTEHNRNCKSVYLKCVVDYPSGPNGPARAQCVARTLAEVLEAEKPKPKPCPDPPTFPPTFPPTHPPTPLPTNPPTHPPTHPATVPPVTPEPTPKPRPLPPVIQPIQNTFCINGKSDINQWVYLPVKIIFRRPPDYTNYGSYPVERGKIQKSRGDIYSPSAYSNVYRHLRNVDVPAKYDECMEPDVPTNTIYVSSIGLNYEGVYKEYAIVDRRLAVTVATAYIAVRKPTSTTDQSYAMLHAQDKCGRACKPICKVPGTEIYRPCSGAISVTGGRPLQFGNSFGDAVLDVWDFNKDKDCPQLTTNTMVVSFYCDFKADWMWPSVDPVPRTAAPPPPKSITPAPQITAACSFGWGCIVRRPCASLTTCQNGEIVSCEKSCSLFARCLNNNFYVHRCRRNETYVHGQGCIRGTCDYRKNRRELRALTSKLKIGTPAKG